ncbi:MAG: carboxypeptidase M32 [Thermoplasmata archaeon]
MYSISEILSDYKIIEALNHGKRLMLWDMETIMPMNGIEERSEVLSNLETYQKKLYMNLNEKLDRLHDENIDNDFSKAVVRILKKQIHYYSSIPDEIHREFIKVTTISEDIWKIARKRNNFKMFEPYLEKIVDLERKIADYLGYEKHPYDALMDIFEEGFTVDDGDRIFNYIKMESKGLVERAIERGYGKNSGLNYERYRKEWLINIFRELQNKFDISDKRFRIDESVHPFTINISPDDVRITTRFEGIDFKKSLFATIHEMGHAIYLLNINREFGCTPLYSAPSYGFDESQSRFFENFIGKSREFTEFIYPVLKKNIPLMKKYDSEDIYYYFNSVGRTPVRIDADELTYNIHIAIRYEIEKNLMENKYEVKELPEIWNSMMEDYLGIKPRNFKEGILQDIHWSQGSFGYFPTYTLGNIIAAIIKYKIAEMDKNIRNGNFIPIIRFLNEKIHIYGSLYEPKELLKKSFNESYNPEYLIKYFNEKYI